MKRLDSDALVYLNAALGITGRGAQVTELLDGQVEQTFDIARAARRGLTPAATEGIFTALMQNVHTDAETLVTLVNPFDVTTGRISPYPGPVPRGFDLWILNANLIQVSGAGTVSAALFLVPGQPQLGWGIDDSGVAVVTTPILILAHWDAVVTETFEFGLEDGKVPTILRGMRLPRNSVLRFSSTSSLTATFRCDLILGLFPATLGQDVIV